jgi:uncharacterized protein (TIGR02453 family)
MTNSKTKQLRFSRDTIKFFDELQSNNTKEWFHTHKLEYENLIKNPLLSLIGELEFEFGSAHLFRPNRDVRFSSNKSPYKTSASFFISSGISGYYFEISSKGIIIGGGIHEPQSDQLLKWRKVFDSEDRDEIKKLI